MGYIYRGCYYGDCFRWAIYIEAVTIVTALVGLYISRLLLWWLLWMGYIYRGCYYGDCFRWAIYIDAVTMVTALDGLYILSLLLWWLL